MTGFEGLVLIRQEDDRAHNHCSDRSSSTVSLLLNAKNARLSNTSADRNICNPNNIPLILKVVAYF